MTIITARKRSLRRLCFYRCLSVHRGRCVWLWGACMVAEGGMHGCRGRALLWGCVHGCRGACVVVGVCVVPGVCVVVGGMRGCVGMHGCRRLCVVVGGCAWLWWVCGCRGCAWLLGVCVVAGGVCMAYNEIRSMSRWYASYWNAFLYTMSTMDFFLNVFTEFAEFSEKNICH